MERMKVLVIGDTENTKEFSMKFPDLKASFRHTYDGIEEILSNHKIIFDFLISDNPEAIELFEQANDSYVFLNTAKTSLAELCFTFGFSNPEILAGFNGLPGFFNRNVLELAVLKDEFRNNFSDVLREMKTPFIYTEDRVGMVTPRVVCMIINEAYYTLQEKTASKEDIDKAMKLGTNYPHGPFEWCEKIGIRNVYEILEAVYNDTRDERYKICPLLKKEYMHLQTI
jgi:3-hydroxybutyryl-CoA dehydrogenase